MRVLSNIGGFDLQRDFNVNSITGGGSSAGRSLTDSPAWRGYLISVSQQNKPYQVHSQKIYDKPAISGWPFQSYTSPGLCGHYDNFLAGLSSISSYHANPLSYSGVTISCSVTSYANSGSFTGSASGTLSSSRTATMQNFIRNAMGFDEFVTWESSVVKNFNSNVSHDFQEEMILSSATSSILQVVSGGLLATVITTDSTISGIRSNNLYSGATGDPTGANGFNGTIEYSVT